VPTLLKDMVINRLSLVRRPANKVPFVLAKSEDADEIRKEELLKAVHHHVEALLDIIGADEDHKEAASKLVDVLQQLGIITNPSDIRTTVSALMDMLYTARSLRELLDEVVGDEEVEAADEEEEEEEDEEGVEKAKLTHKQRKKLPKRMFAWVDEEGKGHFPIHDAAHVRNALARFNQGHFPDKATKRRALMKILRRARELGVEYDEEKWKAVLERLSKEEDSKMSEDTTKNVEQSDQTEQAGISKAELEELVRKARAAEELQKRVETLERERERMVCLEKAAAYPHLGDRETVADIISRLEKSGMDPKSVAQWMETLERAMAESDLLKSVGTDGEPIHASTLESLVDKRAQEIMKSGVPRHRARVQALEEVIRENPHLYAEHRRSLFAGKEV
jgi:hypothetical protein